MDLSHPSGGSVNNLTPSDLCSLRYPFVDDAVDYILALGRYTLLIKIVLKNAYHISLIHQEDRHLWGSIGKVVSMLISVCHLACARLQRSSPLLLIHWHGFLHCQGVTYLLQHLDDFLIFVSAFTDEGRLFPNTIFGILADLQVPVAQGSSASCALGSSLAHHQLRPLITNAGRYTGISVYRGI